MTNDVLVRIRIWISVAVVVSVLLLILYYPVNFERAGGLRHHTAGDISSMSLHMYPHTFTYLDTIKLDNITDEAFIESVLSVLSNHTMRKLYFNFDRSISLDEYPVIASIVIIHKNGTAKSFWIDYDAKYVHIQRTSYKLYGSQFDTKRLYALAREKLGQ